jgi:dihydroorotase-like cyclic amidohydrolase
VFELAAGAPGVELIVALLHDALVARGLPLALLPRLLAEAPARRLGLWPRKGALLPGADADLVILDPAEAWVVDPGTLVTPAGWSPYAGRALRGRVRQVLARGEEVFADGMVTSRPGRGALVTPARAPEPARA